MTITYSNNRIHGLSTDTKPTNAEDGAIFFETDTNKFYDYDLGTTTWNLRPYGLSGILTTDGDMIVRESGVPTRVGVGVYGDRLEVSGGKVYWTSQLPVPSRGVFGGGATTDSDWDHTNFMDYITIDTTGNATDFGDLTVSRSKVAGLANTTRGIFGGGYDGNNFYNTIDYITIATASNATDFGDLTASGQGRMGIAGIASATRGVFGGGMAEDIWEATNVIEYITIDTTGNSTDFGDLTSPTKYLAGVSNATRGIFGGGYEEDNYGRTNVMDYITIDTLGNATDFGDLTAVRQSFAGCANATRGIFAGGNDDDSDETNFIEYITIATTGNATDFGDLTVARSYLAGLASSTRGVFGGGYVQYDAVKTTIDYITIDTTGNATDFGDLTVAITSLAGLSS